MNYSTLIENTSTYPKCFHVRNTFENVPHVYGSIIFSCIVNSLLGLFATTGNAMFLLTIRRTRSLRTPSYCILFSLAVSDLCVGLFVQPFFVVYKAYELKLSPLKAGAHGENAGYFEMYCVFGALADGLGFMLSIVAGSVLAAVSVERFLAIKLHLRYAELVTNARVIKVIIGIWAFALGLTTWLFASQGVHMKPILIILVVTFNVIFFIIVSCNVYIAVVLRRHTRQINSLSHNQQISAVMNTKKLKRSVASMVYVIALYLLCYVPYGVTMLVKALIRYHDPNSIFRAVNTTFPLLFVNSSFNPLLYFWRFRDVRNAAIGLIRNFFKKP